MRLVLVALSLFAALPARAEAPALTVVVVVDQLSGDQLDRNASHLSGGLARLRAEGTVFSDARYTATPTVTSCGHAALSTGAYGEVHGIGGNDWFDRAKQQPVYCVEDAAFRMLGRAPMPHDGTAPTFLRVETLSDVFKAVNPASKVVSIAVKDRSAILLGGHHPDAALWFDRGAGRFNTSSFYGEKLPSWADAENAALEAMRVKGLTWKRTGASAGMKDDAAFEGQTRHQSPNFPHEAKPNAAAHEFSAQFIMSPVADRTVLRLAAAAVQAESLGADDVPDLLLVSLSANDYIVHTWGPESAEARESLVSVDDGLAEFLSLLEKKVGRGRLAVALTSDHGGAPSPELTKAQGLDGGRLDPKKVEEAVESGLTKKFGQKREWLRAFTESGIYLLEADGVDFETEKAEAARLIAAQDGVRAVFRRGHPEDWTGEEGRAAARGYSRQSGGDLIVALSPYWIWAGDVAGHSTAYTYDTRVPLLFWGALPHRLVTRRVDPIDLPSTLAQLAGLPPPNASEGALLPEVLEAAAGSANTGTAEKTSAKTQRAKEVKAAGDFR